VNGEHGSAYGIAESTEDTGNDRHPLVGDIKSSDIDIYKEMKVE